SAAAPSHTPQRAVSNASMSGRVVPVGSGADTGGFTPIGSVTTGDGCDSARSTNCGDGTNGTDPGSGSAAATGAVWLAANASIRRRSAAISARADNVLKKPMTPRN